MQHDQLIIFDLDDTLVDTSDLYWRTRSAFVKLIDPLVAANSDEIVDAFERIDSVHIRQDGFSPARYFKTMLKTYESLKPPHSITNDDILKAIEQCARLITTEFPKPITGAAELLEWAFSRFDLALITRGQKDLQLEKLDRVGFRKYFHLIEVVDKKTSETFQTVIAHAGFKANRTWVIGDSIQTDINPGIQAGSRCIWYAYRHESYYWQQEHGHTPVGEFDEISDLRDAISILAKSADASVRAA